MILGKAVAIGTGVLFGDDHHLFGPLEIVCVVDIWVRFSYRVPEAGLMVLPDTLS